MLELPAIRDCFLHQQEESVPPNGPPNFPVDAASAAGGREASPARVMQTRGDTNMTTTTENQTTKAKQVPDFYIFENGPNNGPGKPVGAAFAHKKGKGFTFLV